RILQGTAMFKIFNHYFRRRIILQIAMYSMVIVSTLIVSLALQGGVGVFNGAVISSGVIRGGVMAIGIIGVNFALGLYDRPGKLTIGQVRARAVLSFVLSMIIAASILLLLPLQPPYQNEQTLIALLLIVGGMLVMRLLGNEMLPSSYTRQRVLIYGTGGRASIVGQSLLENDPSIELIGYFRGPQEKGPVIQGLNVITPGKTLTDVVREQRVNEIVVALSERRGGSMPLRELLDCKLQGIRVIDLATHFEQLLGQIHLEAVSAGWLIFGDGFKQGLVRSVVKRLFDIVGSGILLLVSSPVMLVTALLIFIESGRPIFYRQERVGRNGDVFDVIKFRSMRQDAEKDGTPRWAGAGDTRVTRVGKIIRKMRIDELPQLFCVLKGDMSLVGPRPERPYFVERLTLDIPYYALRHGIKPGLTGWAQVRYHYGASIKDAEQKLQYDLYYVKNHSWLLDLIILFETVGVVLTGKGAQ
ncbi:MAG TPA: TIGR03013 family PEP-CTERM/XrtA system glycosyltransferase, partial [Alicycliphilus denitrificans]|nr:TIGR03013 family PEP-CTERM/XrtA system glycosyltransferase [Alicycliphilus denitrificans]